MPQDTAFDIDVAPDIDPGQTLLVGLSSMGMAGLTAVDYLVRHLDSTEIGHVSPEELPAITPVENGVPRHHTRLYNLDDVDLTVLLGELFVPVNAARSFADSLLEWVAAGRIQEGVVLHGVPFPHGPEEHVVFHVATEAYREKRLDGADIQPLGGGYLEGVPGELVSRSLTGDAPPVGVYVTPAHPPGPDIDAAVRFLDVVERLYGVEVDRQEIEDLSEEIKQHYANLADRMAALEEKSDRYDDRDFPEDRMFM